MREWKHPTLEEFNQKIEDYRKKTGLEHIDAFNTVNAMAAAEWQVWVTETLNELVRESQGSWPMEAVPPRPQVKYECTRTHSAPQCAATDCWITD